MAAVYLNGVAYFSGSVKEDCDTTAIEEMLWQGQIAAECQLSDDSQLVTSDGESILLTKKI